MKSIHEVSKLAGISIRTLQYYDQINLLPPSARTEAGYRLYADQDLERLQQILLYRELEFSLKDIKAILYAKDFDRQKALEQQIELLSLKRDHLETLITLARNMKNKGANFMNFSAFDHRLINEYTAQAKAAWGHTEEYKEFAVKSSSWTPADTADKHQGLMNMFIAFSEAKNQSPASDAAQTAARQLQQYITDHFYTCSNAIFAGLGQMYGAGGSFTENINAACGDGTAEFASEAISIYCRSK